MDITELLKQEQKEQEEQEKENRFNGNFEPSSFVIPEDAGFLADIDELTIKLHKNLVNLYSNPAAINDELIKRNGNLLAMLDKYIDTRKTIYMITKTKLFI